MRKRILAFVFVAALLMALAVPLFSGVGTASAHVHGITPLLQCSVDDPNSGVNGANGTPADAANGGPIMGLIPNDVGEADLTPMVDGGFGATAGHCP